MKAAHLLLVDDDPDLGAALTILARRSRMRITRVADVNSARQALGQDAVDLVLLDINLPGSSGLDLLLSSESQPGVEPRRTALFTQPGLWTDLARGWSLGAGYWLSKSLVTRPEIWRLRLAEILEHVSGKRVASLLEWILDDVLSGKPSWVIRLNQLFDRVAAHSLGNEVIREVILRALRLIKVDKIRSMTYLSEANRLDHKLCESTWSTQQKNEFCRCINEQLWCLLDPDARLPLKLLV